MDVIYLPVSLGEAIDKLTILHIKNDNKLDVQKEYGLLYNKLKEFISTLNASMSYIDKSKPKKSLW